MQTVADSINGETENTGTHISRMGLIYSMFFGSFLTP